MTNTKDKNVFRKIKTDIRLNVPKDLFLYEGIKPVDIVIYELIDMLSYQKGYCWATIETFQKSLHIGSNNTIINSIKKLESYNFIATEKVYSNGSIRKKIWPIRNVVENVISDNRNTLNRIELQGKEDILNYNWIEIEEEKD